MTMGEDETIRKGRFSSDTLIYQMMNEERTQLSTSKNCTNINQSKKELAEKDLCKTYTNYATETLNHLPVYAEGNPILHQECIVSQNKPTNPIIKTDNSSIQAQLDRMEEMLTDLYCYCKGFFQRINEYYQTTEH